MSVAHDSGGTVLVLTANPDAELPRRANDVIVIPGQTVRASAGERPSIQPMGSLYEQAMWLYLDYVVLRLARWLGRHSAK
jgi:6-phospho-3-hexuloisomerase